MHNTIFRKNVRLVKERAHMSASIGWQQSKDDVADRSMAVPCHADFVSTEGGDFSFFFLCVFFRSSTPLFTALLSVQCIKTRFFETATVPRSFVEDFHLNVIPTSLLHRRDLHKFLWNGRMREKKKFARPTTISTRFANKHSNNSYFYIACEEIDRYSNYANFSISTR